MQNMQQYLSICRGACYFYTLQYILYAAVVGGTATSRLLLKVLHGIKSIKETQTVHRKILNHLMKAGAMPSSFAELQRL